MKKRFKRIRKIAVGSVFAIIGTLTLNMVNFKSVYASNNPKMQLTDSDDKDTSNVTSKSGDEEHVSCVGSVSKVYVTTAAMQLVEAGKIRLDAPVTEYLPEFKMVDERYKDITVAMLMDHTSGIMGTSGVSVSCYDDDDVTSFEHRISDLNKQHLKANPGEYAAYCNDGFDVLALIVERVSGMSYAEYIKENIASKVGASHTATADNLDEMDNLANLYMFGNNRLDFEYCISLGAGGMYATASDMARFGSGFFTGNNAILSEESKEYMAKKWYEEEKNASASYDKDYMAESASGWDIVTQKKYEDAGVKVLGKGGDINTQHAYLMVAPDENISISVLSTEGSSMYNGLFAEALLDEVLAEYGKEINDTAAFSPEIAENISDECMNYEGYYCLDNGAYKVCVEDNKLKIYSVIEPGKDPYVYLPCENNGFVKVDDNGNLSSDKEIIYFEESSDGNIYIKKDSVVSMPNLGNYNLNSYCGQKIQGNPVSEEVINIWQQYDGKVVTVMNAKYSSLAYDAPYLKIKLSDELPGYVIAELGVYSRLLKIVDENVCEAFTTIPSDANRDLVDIRREHISLQDGREVVCITSSTGTSYMLTDDMPLFTNDVKTVQLASDEAVWYRIDDQAADMTITLNRPEKSAVYVYNKYKEPVYSSHVETSVSEISLPQGGYIVFIGETGDEIAIN